MQHWVFIIILKLQITMLDFCIILINFTPIGFLFLLFYCLWLNLRLNFIRFSLFFIIWKLFFISVISLIIGLIVFMTHRMLLFKLSHIHGLAIQYLLWHFLDILPQLTHGLLAPFPFFFNGLILRFPDLFNHFLLHFVKFLS